MYIPLRLNPPQTCTRPYVPACIQAMEQRQAANREASSRHSHSPDPQAPATAARQAIKQWGRVDRRVRQALKRASPALLFDLEWQLLDPLLEVRETLQL